MASSKRCCVICSVESDEKIVFFTEVTLLKCKTTLTIRTSHKLKHCDIDLPSLPNELQGYHPSCYKSFTAISKKYRENKHKPLQGESNEDDCPQPSTSQEENIISESSQDGTAEPNESTDKSKTCIFCNRARKSLNKKTQHLSQSTISSFQKIKEYAIEIDDIEFLRKLEEKSATSKELFYHTVCRVQYQNKCISVVQSKSNTIWQTKKSIYKEAFDDLCFHIQIEIVKNQNSIMLSTLCSIFRCILQEKTDSTFVEDEASYSQQHLECKIQTSFRKDIKIITVRKKKIVVPAGGIQSDLNDAMFSSLEEDDVLQQAALLLRKKVLNIKTNQLPNDLTTEDIIKGECSVPESLHEFLLTLTCGSDQRRRTSTNRLQKCNSLAQDIIYVVKNGEVKTSKHMALGLTLKSLTKSRKIVDIINKYGHCCSYNVVEKLETELTCAATKSSQVCPAGILLNPDLCTGVAFDNFDRFVETSSGKDTMHDTVGIVFQFVQSNSLESEYLPAELPIVSQAGISGQENDALLEDPTVEDFQDTDAQTSSAIPDKRKTVRKRKMFDAIIPDIAPYHKKPRIIDCFSLMDNNRSEDYLDSLTSAVKTDLLWMFSHAFKIPNSPMWVEFNSQIYEDYTLQQKIAYLTPINLSPTNNSVVLHTLHESKKIAEECSQRYIQVTYDLAIFKIALQLQSTEAPLFNNVFIHMGQFHIMLAFFKAVGKVIDECGLSHMMVESDLLAAGSVHGFITGKTFNRCKRLHQIVSLGLQIMHFEAFLEHESIEISDDMKLELENMQKTRYCSTVYDSGPISKLTEQYLEYKQKTIAGEFGKTAQFYLVYINLVNYYQMLSRSIRTADFELYKYVLPQIANLFFILNQPNYARWLVKYHDNLHNVENTHPGLIEEFKKGSFGVKRTGKPFSRQPIDLTLKQTINADAARRLTGVSHFKNSISARQRWAKNHAIRSTIISHVLQKINLTKTQDVTSDLEANKMKKHVACVDAFMNTVKKNMNPFDKNLNEDLLFNIATGRAAKDSTANFLLNVEKNGNCLRETFISECSEDAQRFEKPIKRNAVLNFSSDSEKKNHN